MRNCETRFLFPPAKGNQREGKEKDTLPGVFQVAGVDSNHQPPGYGRQSQTAHRRPPGDPILGSLTIFGSKEPGGLRLMNRRPDLSLKASPGDDFAWKIMIPFKSARKFSGFGSNHSCQNRRPDSSLEASPSNNTTGKLLPHFRGQKNIAVFGSGATISVIISNLWN
jgi:hypothetical protein